MKLHHAWARTLALASLVLLATACGAVMSAISVIAPLVSDALIMVDAVHDYVDAQDALDQGTKDKLHDAIESARSAFKAVDAAARAAKSLDDRDLNRALAEAKEAWDALLELGKRHGVQVKSGDPQLFGGRYGSQPDGGVIVPDFDTLAERNGWR